MHDSVLGKHLEPIAAAASVSLWNRPPTMGLLCYGPLGPVVGPLDLGVFVGLGRGNVYGLGT